MSSLLSQLQAPDPISLCFGPIGLGSPLAPADAAAHQARTIANAQLVDAVPDAVRENFERARKLHLHGVLEYEFFTAAADYALLVLEAALRLRFISYYENRIPVFQGSEATFLEAVDFDAVLAAKRKTMLRRDERKHPLPRYLKALLKWAREERLLPGRRTRIVDGALVNLRNHAAHPTGHSVHGPPDSAGTLRDVAEYVNCLWGVRSQEGRLFGGPLRRRVRVAAVGPDGSSAEMGLHHVPDLPVEEQCWTYSVFLAADEEHLTLPFRGFAYQEGFQQTMYPCEHLWTGGWGELAAKVEAGEFFELADEVEYFDRLFLLRLGEEGPDLARSPTDLLTLADPPSGTWLAVVADTPQEAFIHVRDHELSVGPDCSDCFVEVQGKFDTTDDVAAFVWDRH